MGSQETGNELLTDAEKEFLKEEEGAQTPETKEEPTVETDPAVNEEPVVEETKQEEQQTETDTEPEIEEKEEEEPEQDPLPQTFRYDEVAMTDTVPDDLKQKLDALDAEMEEGEMDVIKYMNQRSQIEKQITAFQIQEANEQKEFNKWMDVQDAFLSANRQYVDNKILNGALDSALKEIQADPRAKGLNVQQIFAAADYLVKSTLGGLTEEQKPANNKKEEVPAEKQSKPANTLPDIPTLTNVPASNANDTGVDPFAAIDRLVGAEKEAALAKLTESQLEAYLKG